MHVTPAVPVRVGTKVLSVQMNARFVIPLSFWVLKFHQAKKKEKFTDTKQLEREREREK